jgi:hypothetical protein
MERAMSILDMVQQHLGPSEVNQISRQLGIDPSVAQTAIAAAVPMILGGMAGHAAQPQGAETIQQAIGAHEGVTDDVSGVLGAGPPADVTGGAGGLLGRILGAHRDTVQQGVQQASGLDPQKARQLLLMLTPIVLGVLARREFGGQKAHQADPQQVSGALRQEAESAQHDAQRQAPHVGGLLGRILSAVEAPRA